MILVRFANPVKSLPHVQPPIWPVFAWLTIVLAGFALPVAALLILGSTAHPSLTSISAPLLAVGLMGTGMIAAAVSGRLWIGLVLALLSGAGLILLAHAFSIPMSSHPLLFGLVALVTSFSFAARGALFATSGKGRGWWIAVFVVAGEAAVIATAVAEPGLLPDWLLALLPAQWASLGIQSAFTGRLSSVAIAALIALGGTAAATLLVRMLWPRRWTYLVMFSTWLALSALVYHQL